MRLIVNDGPGEERNPGKGKRAANREEKFADLRAANFLFHPASVCPTDCERTSRGIRETNGRAISFRIHKCAIARMNSG